MRKMALLVLCCCLFSFESTKKTKDIEIVLCVDLSASMNGLVQDLRSSIWEIVYDFSRYYPSPNVKIGIVAYGRLTYLKENSYVKKFHNLTDYHDDLVWSLMKEVNNVSDGNSQVTKALEECLTNINWTMGKGVDRNIFVIGNGSFLGERGLDKMVDYAVKRNIRISTLHYQNRGAGPAEIDSWKKLAKDGKGIYQPFGFKESDIVFHKKYNPELIKDICDLINETYIYYGKKGQEQFELMKELDEFAKKCGDEVIEERAVFKASSYFQHQNASWDLVDRFTTDEVKLDKIDREYLPEILRSMNTVQLRDYIRLKKSERKELIAQMAIQNAKRDLYLYRKRYKMGVFRTDKDFTTALLLGLNQVFSKDYRITY